jgi:hypothetical protein
MSNRVVWTPSTDTSINHYILQSSADALTWAQIANITHDLLNPAVFDAVGGVFYFVDMSGVNSTWYRVQAVDSLSQASAWSVPFQAGSVVPLGFYGYGGEMALSQLMALARQESDTENDEHISDDELVMYLNQSRLELYDLLILSFGEDYYTASADIVTDGVNQLFPLPNGILYGAAPPFYKGLLVEARATGNGGLNAPVWITLLKFNFHEKNRYNLINQALVTGYMWPRYRLHGPNIMYQPMPTSGIYTRLWYAPKLKPMTALTDVADDWGGWLEYVVVDAAIKCVMKQERDPSGLIARKNSLKMRIEAAAANRDLGEPNTVTETNPAGYGAMGGGPFGAYGPWG